MEILLLKNFKSRFAQDGAKTRGINRWISRLCRWRFKIKILDDPIGLFQAFPQLLDAQGNVKKEHKRSPSKIVNNCLNNSSIKELTFFLILSKLKIFYCLGFISKQSLTKAIISFNLLFQWNHFSQKI